MTTRCALVRPRTTVPLTGTTTKPQALLDHRATVSLSYATRVVSRELALTVPASGITRRALVLYANHLEAMQPEQLRHEAYAVRDGCKALRVTQEAPQVPTTGSTHDKSNHPAP